MTSHNSEIMVKKCCWFQRKRKKPTDATHKTLYFPQTLFNNTSWYWIWSRLLCDFSKWQWTRQGHKVEWSKNIQLHIFPGTGKRHGLVVVVVSGMALGEFRGERWRLYSLDIHLTTQKYFQLFSGSWNETVRAPLMLCEDDHRQRMSQVWCLSKWMISPTTDQSTLRWFFTKTKMWF